MRRVLSAVKGPLTLEDLVDRARAGEAAAIGGLYDRYAAVLFSTAYRITASRLDAEDVVHDLFVGLPDALRRYEDRGQFGAWLKRIAVRLALVRARADRRARAASLEESGSLIAPDRTDFMTDLNELQRAVMSLPNGLRAVLVLKQVEGYTHEEIAALLGISPGASRVRLTRAVEMLRHSIR